MPYRNEEEYWNAYYDIQDEAEKEAMASAELGADLIEFDSDEEREEYIQREYMAEFERLMTEKMGR